MTKNTIGAILLSLFFSLNCLAQQPISMRSNALGGLGMAFQDINSIFFNPAGIKNIDGISGVLSAERRFNLADLNTFSLGLAIPIDKNSAVGLSMNQFGFELYNQQKYGLVYARQLMSKFTVGAEVNLHNYMIQEYGNDGTLSFELGFQYDLSKSLVLGGKLSNPVQQELASGEHLPTAYQFGLGYTPSEKLWLGLDVEKQIDFDTNVKLGIEYHIIEVLYLRLGVATEPSLLSFGIGLALKNGFKMDIASSYHQVLGWSPGLSLLYQGEQKRKRKRR